MFPAGKLVRNDLVSSVVPESVSRSVDFILSQRLQRYPV
jgi:hypothetical protein